MYGSSSALLLTVLSDAAHTDEGCASRSSSMPCRTLDREGCSTSYDRAMRDSRRPDRLPLFSSQSSPAIEPSCQDEHLDGSQEKTSERRRADNREQNQESGGNEGYLPLPVQISMLYHRNLNRASRFIKQLKPMEYMAWKSLPKSTLRNLVNKCLFSAYCRQPGKYIPSFLMVNAGCMTISTQNFRPLLHWTKVHSSVMSFIAALGRIISLIGL